MLKWLAPPLISTIHLNLQLLAKSLCRFFKAQTKPNYGFITIFQAGKIRTKKTRKKWEAVQVVTINSSYTTAIGHRSDAIDGFYAQPKLKFDALEHVALPLEWPGAVHLRVISRALKLSEISALISSTHFSNLAYCWLGTSTKMA